MNNVIYQRDDAVATITLNRPERMNTISHPMLLELSEALLEAGRDGEVRVVIVTGAGRAFCAGLDLQDAASDQGIAKGGFALAPTLELRDFPPVVLHQMDKPVICAINGGAAGFGIDLALGCDIRLCATQAKLAVSFTRRGVMPETGGTWILPRLIGWSKAAELVFAGRTLSAAEALDLGLVSRVAEPEELMSAAQALAQEIASSAPLAVQATKRMMRAALTEGFAEHVQRAYLQTLPLIQSNDFREGYTAFLEKRQPQFRGN